MKVLAILPVVLLGGIACVPVKPYGDIALKTNYTESRFQDGAVEAAIQFVECASQSVQAVGCKGFELTVNNKSTDDLFVDWNKTIFIEDGQSGGGFMFEGVIYKDRNAAKPDDVIFPGNQFRKKIFPNKLVSFSAGRYGGWVHEYMPMGHNGVYLTLRDAKNQERRIKLLAEIRAHFQ